jgi:hypothetical protein
MIDVNQITSTLRGLPDRALQQYAMMHKGDPYILSLAVSESNQRKQLRAAGQGQAGAMPQPKVADAAIAGMAQQQLPENQGIAQIPTPNIQRMADGGIAGYEDDEEGMATGGMGGMFNFAQQSEPVVRMSGGGEVPRYQFGGALSGDFSGFGGLTPEQEAKAEIQAAEQERVKKIIALEQKVAFLKSAGAPQAQEAQKQLDALKADMRPKPSPTDPNFRRQTDPRITGTAAAPPPPPPPPPPPTPSGTNPATSGVRDLLPPPPKLDTSFKPAAMPTADEAIAQGEKIFNSKARIGEINRQVLQEQMDADKAKENSIEALRAFNEKQGPAYAGYEKLLQKEELQDATDKEKAGLTALFKGFLAIAAGESPNAATNIAKGSMVGLEEYSGAMKEFKKSAKERNKEMQNIQQARRAEERGDFKEERMYTDKAETARQASARFGLAAINDITNTSGKVNADILQNMRSITSTENIAGAREAGANTRLIAEQAGLNTRAAMSENRADLRSQTPEKILFDQLRTKHGGDALKATEEMQKLKAEKFNLYDSYSKYLTAFANKEGVSPPITFDQYAKQFIPEVKPNKNTTIRTQPGG